MDTTQMSGSIAEQPDGRALRDGLIAAARQWIEAELALARTDGLELRSREEQLTEAIDDARDEFERRLDAVVKGGQS